MVKFEKSDTKDKDVVFTPQVNNMVIKRTKKCFIRTTQLVKKGKLNV